MVKYYEIVDLDNTLTEEINALMAITQVTLSDYLAAGLIGQQFYHISA